ncbi:hypothetical protein NBRC116601_11990 [Cognatishimia sp. WU-CL00825]
MTAAFWRRVKAGSGAGVSVCGWVIRLLRQIRDRLAAKDENLPNKKKGLPVWADLLRQI